MKESIIKKNCSTTCVNKYFVLFQGYRKDNKLDVSERPECDRVNIKEARKCFTLFNSLNNTCDYTLSCQKSSQYLKS